MSVRIGNRVFAPRPLAALFTAAALAAFVSLGYWQLGRAREKQALIDSFIAGNLTSVDATGIGFGGIARYQHVRLRGSYDATRQILLDNMPSTRTGRPGFRVLTPLERSDGKGWVMVDRGWVPLGATREHTPEVTVDGREREVRGRLDRLPVPGLRLGQAVAPGAEGWPRIMNFPLEVDVEAALGAKVESRIVLLDPDLPDGYEREWRPSLGFGPDRHLGYAIQWFSAALAAVVIFLALSLRREPPAAASLPT
jgi:surfeit locus 1 family protein